jgi:hypothetical protein
MYLFKPLDVHSEMPTSLSLHKRLYSTLIDEIDLESSRGLRSARFHYEILFHVRKRHARWLQDIHYNFGNVKHPSCVEQPNCQRFKGVFASFMIIDIHEQGGPVSNFRIEYTSPLEIPIG